MLNLQGTHSTLETWLMDESKHSLYSKVVCSILLQVPSAFDVIILKDSHIRPLLSLKQLTFMLRRPFQYPSVAPRVFPLFLVSQPDLN
jgi:hypothetical protein